MQLIPRKNDTIKKVSDPRLFRHNGEIYLLFCDNTKRANIDLINPGVQTLAKLVKKDDSWEVEDLVELSFPGAEEFYKKKLVQKNIEKNWMPFSLEGKLYVIYLLEPEKIVIEVNVKTGHCKLASRSENGLIDKFSPLRGGTPPIYDEELGEFITIYHVAFPGTHKFTNLERRIYIAGAYCFTKDHPFRMTKKSIGPFYEKNIYNTRKKIIFPTGLVKKGNDLLMFYGEDDYRMRVARINRDKLLSKMKRINDTLERRSDTLERRSDTLERRSDTLKRRTETKIRRNNSRIRRSIEHNGKFSIRSSI